MGSDVAAAPGAPAAGARPENGGAGRTVARQPFLHDLAVTLRAPVVCLSGTDGQIREGGTQGVLAADVRVLSRAVVTVDGREPEPVAHGVGSASAEHFLGVLRHVGVPGPDPTVWLRRDREVRPDGLVETFTLVNRSDESLSVELALDVTADLVPIATIKAGRPGAAVTDGVAVTVDLPADGRWSVAVPARSSAARRWSLSVQDSGAVVVPPPRGLDRALSVRADDPRLARLVDRALGDLDALLLAAPGSADVFAGAGAPWYLTLFGRDSLWTASMLLPVDRRLAAGTLRTLARLQGTRTDPATGEEPGKIPHERRRAAAAYGGGHSGTATLLPPLYYGTVDATALWVCLLHDAWRWGLPAAEVEPLLPHLDAALGWIGGGADRDGDGFAEYVDESGRGLVNQGWKDSGDAVRFADGTVATGPVALVEVQGYHHEAALGGAALLEAFGRPGAPRWRAFAADLAARFRARFWTAAGHPALALDGAKHPVDALTSNIGHLLGTGLVDAAESERIGARLLAPDMASGWGLRTMSSSAGGYSPLSYHCGSVWPHDTAIVMRNLGRAGRPDRAATLAGALLAAAEAFDGRLPELYAGFGPDEMPVPVPYPAACRPQAWSSAAVVAVVAAVLGIEVDVPGSTITLSPPSPSPVGAVRVRGLAVGEGRLDVDLDRAGRVVHAAAPAGMRVVARPQERASTGADR